MRDGGGNQDQARNVVLAHMASALESVDGNNVHPYVLGLAGVARGGALVDHTHPGRLEGRHVLVRVVAGRLHDLDARFDDGVAVFDVRHGLQCRQKSQVHAKWAVRHVLDAGDLAPQVLRTRLGQRGQDAQGARVRDGRDEFGAGDPLHAALHDGMLDAEHAGNCGLQLILLGIRVFCMPTSRAPAPARRR
ncbi:hypothetical protein D3C72_1633680 [compost metagenome]